MSETANNHSYRIADLLRSLAESERVAAAYRALLVEATRLDLPYEVERLGETAEKFDEDAESIRDQLAMLGYVPSEA